MNQVAMIVLLGALSGCVSTLTEVRQAEPEKTIEYPVDAETLSYCVHRAVEGIDSAYTYRLSHSPDRREFFISATRLSDAITLRQMAGMEVRFLSHVRTTTVELRKGDTDGWWLARDTWPLIEHCSQQLTQPSPDAGTARSPASPN